MVTQSGFSVSTWSSQDRFLHDSGHASSVLDMHGTCCQRSTISGPWTLAVIQKPGVSPDVSMEPHSMIEGGGLNSGRIPAEAVPQNCRVQNRKVRGVHDGRSVNQRIVRVDGFGSHPVPRMIWGFASLNSFPGWFAGITNVYRPGSLKPRTQLTGIGLNSVNKRRQRFRIGYISHG